VSQNTSPQLGQRGTPLWAFNHIRKDFLPSLLKDLKGAEESGLDEELCELLKELLRILVANSATNDPVQAITQTWELLDEFREKYGEWNDDSPDPETRRERRQELKKIREKIARKARTFPQELDEHVNKDHIVQLYQRIGDISSQYPDVFSNIAFSVNRFTTRNVEFG
jgi:hypothetical protein